MILKIKVSGTVKAQLIVRFSLQHYHCHNQHDKKNSRKRLMSIGKEVTLLQVQR